MTRVERARAMFEACLACGLTEPASQALRALHETHLELQGAAKGRGRRAKTPRAAKAKGRAGVVEARDLILAAFPQLEGDDVLIQTTSVGGSDLHFSPKAKAIFPFGCEIKNVETLNIWKALAQARVNAGKKDGSEPLLFFRRNNSSMYVAVDAARFLRLLSSTVSDSSAHG